MNRKTRWLFRLQYVMGRISVFFVAPVVFVMVKFLGYRIEDIGQVREAVRNILEGHRGGWIICANHLTMIDSVFVAWALMPFSRYAFQYRSLPWNLPERDNFQKNVVIAILCYLTKCLPIHRGGDRGEMKKTLEICSWLLGNGSSLLIFPEGGRSRSGRINPENASYGVGRLVQGCPSARVLCIYLRGLRQESYSTIPRWGERFVVLAEPFEPSAARRGLKGQRDMARQIVENLARMEGEWVALVSSRYRQGEQIPAVFGSRRDASGESGVSRV